MTPTDMPGAARPRPHRGRSGHSGRRRLVGRRSAGTGPPHRGPRGPAGRRLPLLQRRRSERAVQRRRHDEVRQDHLPDDGPRPLLGAGAAPLHDRRRHLRAPRHDRRLLQHRVATSSATASRARRTAGTTSSGRSRAFGLGRKDIVANLNFFMNVPVEADGQMAIVDGWSKPGDHVDLRAEMDVLVADLELPADLQPVQRRAPDADPARDLRAGERGRGHARGKPGVFLIRRICWRWSRS